MDTVEYGYTATVWGDLLCSYDGQGLGCDDLGNLTITGINVDDRRYVWKHGRELSQLTEDGTTWTYTYNADGLRTKRTDGTTTYQYIYADGQLQKLRVAGQTLNFCYDAAGTPMAVQYNGTYYYYVTNLQGDVIALTNDAGAAVVSYTYDAWGQILSITGSMADTLGAYNPLRYRGYVYDVETELYYLQSRYYDPELGRFISPDGYNSTGQGFTGNNMFVYCGNCPVLYKDESGTRYIDAFSVASETKEQRDRSFALQKKVISKEKMPTTNIPTAPTTPQPKHWPTPKEIVEQIEAVERQKQELDNEILMQQVDSFQNGLETVWDAYNHSITMYQKSQEYDAQMLLYRFSTPSLTKETLGVIAAELGVIGLYWGGPSLLQVSVWLQFAAAIIPTE